MTKAKKTEEEKAMETDNYWDASHDGEDGIIIRIYEIIKNEGNGKPEKKFVDKVDYKIEEDELGKLYGKGKYYLYSNKGQDGKVMTKTITISDVFGIGEIRLRNLANEKTGGSNPANQTQPQAENKESTLDIVLKVMKIAEPFVNKVVDAINGSKVDKADQFEKMSTTMLNSNVKLMGSVSDKMLQMTFEGIDKARKKDEETPEPEWFKEYIPGLLEMVQKFGDKYLNSTGPAKAGMDYLIKSDDNYEQFSGDPKAIEAAYDEMKADPNIGEEKANAFLTKLGLKVADDEPKENENVTT